jgi:methionyl-tRNA synthetase
VHPRQFRDEVLAFVRGGLDDISVSRTVRRARGWGIGVPDDPTQVIYVWFDALTNYLSSLDFGDPASEQYRRWWERADRRVHVIGKGILRFHAVYWPAFLLSAGLPVPTRIEVHPYLTVGGAKISKSGPCRGVADPFDVAERYGTDALRWWFARDVSAVADTDFTEPRLVQRANEDLANGFGNVVNRIRSLVARRPPSSRLSPDELPIPAVTGLAGNVARAISDFDHRSAAELLLEAVDALNRDLQVTAPWQLAASDRPADAALLDALLVQYLVSARTIAAALAPIVPSLSIRLLDVLDAPGVSDPPVPRLELSPRH